MQCGTPSVTTSIGAEGMKKSLDWNGIIVNDPLEIANASIDLYINKALWQKSQQNGVEILEKCYLPTTGKSDFLNTLKDLEINIKNHRTQNFMGAMLMHHSIASTKFMSKWIEEKNKAY